MVRSDLEVHRRSRKRVRGYTLRKEEDLFNGHRCTSQKSTWKVRWFRLLLYGVPFGAHKRFCQRKSYARRIRERGDEEQEGRIGCMRREEMGDGSGASTSRIENNTKQELRAPP